MTDEKSNSRDLFSVKNISIGLVIVLLLPIPISLIISSGNWLSFIDGNSTVWIGFWGSYLGGIIGTIGVIFVAHLQNKENKKSTSIILKDNRDVMLKELQLKQLEKYFDLLQQLDNDLQIIESVFDELKDAFNKFEVHNDKKLKLFFNKHIIKLENFEENNFRIMTNNILLLSSIFSDNKELMITNPPNLNFYLTIDSLLANLIETNDKIQTNDGPDSLIKIHIYELENMVRKSPEVNNSKLLHEWVILERDNTYKSTKKLMNSFNT